ncbi:MAG: hypothetical protein E7167_02720 [Firmicutes bacterium]|nr:hypothetical protein [Bacillota bacterium]
MNISELEKAIKEIEDRSKQSHEETFALASTEKYILRTEIDKYEGLLKDLEAIRQYEQFVADHQDLVEEYRRLETRVGQIKKPAQKVVNRRKSTGAKKKPATTTEVKVEEKVVPEVEVTTEVAIQPEVKVEKKNSGTNTEFKLPDFSLIQALPAGKAKEEEIVVEKPVVDPYAYRMTKDKIIQDLPIRDLSEQKFQTPGMTDDQIKESQAKLAAIPIVDPKTYIDPIEEEIERRKKEHDAIKKAPVSEYKAMTDEEIEAARRKINDVPVTAMTEEEIEASRRKINEVPVSTMSPEEIEAANKRIGDLTGGKTEPKPEEPSAKKETKKVVKRRRFDWKNNFVTRGINKAYLVIKGLVFSENMNGRTKDYVDLSIAIANYRSAFKGRSPEVNNKELTAIDDRISKSEMLTVDEKKKLYRKLTKLAKQVEKENRRQQNAAMKDNHNIIDDLSDSFGLGR